MDAPCDHASSTFHMIIRTISNNSLWHGVARKRKGKKLKNPVIFVCYASKYSGLPGEFFFKTKTDRKLVMLLWSFQGLTEVLMKCCHPPLSSKDNIVLHKQMRGIYKLGQWERESLRGLLDASRAFNVFWLVHVNLNHSCRFKRSASVIVVEKVAVEYIYTKGRLPSKLVGKLAQFFDSTCRCQVSRLRYVAPL